MITIDIKCGSPRPLSRFKENLTTLDFESFWVFSILYLDRNINIILIIYEVLKE